MQQKRPRQSFESRDLSIQKEPNLSLTHFCQNVLSFNKLRKKLHHFRSNGHCIPFGVSFSLQKMKYYFEVQFFSQLSIALYLSRNDTTSYRLGVAKRQKSTSSNYKFIIFKSDQCIKLGGIATPALQMQRYGK